ncbi:MAG: tryptophan--tRNA ligase [Candidatus Altiarchaeota archaeon]|nr:tryptophan--tRNA ligase [Candidatus Altiarchaeota archaeon]
MLNAYDVSGEIDYDKVIREFGAKKIDARLAARIDHPLVPELFFAHRDLDTLLSGKFAIVSGRGPSKRMHIAHLLVYRFVKHLQDRFGSFVFLPLSDDEKLLANSELSQEDVKKEDYENLLDIIAIGFDPDNTEVMIDMMDIKQEVYNLSIRLARRMTANTVRSAFGFSGETNIGIQFYPAMQAAHILYPSLKLGLPVLVPIGLDQDVFVKLTRDVAEKEGLKKPGDILSKFLPGLTGDKMSSSKPETAIYTTDLPNIVKKKIGNAFTGGRVSVDEQRKLGGEPDKCVVYSYLRTFFQIDQREKCLSGEILCGECKAQLTGKLNSMLAEHQKKRESAKLQVSKFTKAFD